MVMKKQPKRIVYSRGKDRLELGGKSLYLVRNVSFARLYKVFDPHISNFKIGLVVIYQSVADFLKAQPKNYTIPKCSN